jgi:hypothetical protein
MMLEKWISAFSRIFFVLAFAVLAVAVIERIVNFAGYTIVGRMYTGGRLLEFSGILLLFVIAIQIREVRETIRALRSS